jgi:hypothetical protein
MDISNLPNKKEKGRILRVKLGYNPNSSSMGSMVFVFPATLLVVTVGFGAISGIIMSVFIKRSGKKVKNDTADASKKVKGEERI